MPENPFSLSFAAGLQNLKAAGTTRFALDKASFQPVFIDLSQTAAKANIVRGGFDVPQAEFLPDALDRWLGGIGTQKPKETPRVVSQSIKSGKKVPTGTSIDLVLAPSRDIPLSIFAGTHADLKDRTVALFLEQTLDQEEHKKILSIVLAKADAEKLSEAEEEAVRSMLEGANVDIDDTDNEKSFAAAYRSLRYSSAFR